MKRAILLLMFGLAITFVNAQDNSKSTEPKTDAKQTKPSGEVTRTPVKVADLLKPITDNLAADYKDYTVKEAFKVVKGGVTSYVVVVEKGTEKFRLFYDADGKFVRKGEANAMRKTNAAPASQDTPKK